VAIVTDKADYGFIKKLQNAMGIVEYARIKPRIVRALLTQVADEI
jgi:hypothetical protein